MTVQSTSEATSKHRITTSLNSVVSVMLKKEKKILHSLWEFDLDFFIDEGVIQYFGLLQPIGVV